ncbi:hypothetical protein, partial [uncultured Mucilaginibacter sp.]|uniref:hypothetical protein n=1 Tax=uncultured Mucilaginibacter sp. TaxID=797541 RepID=UPI0025CDE93D
TNPNASASLDIYSHTKGLLIPRMTSTERANIPSLPNGLLVFDIDSGCVLAFDSISAVWKNLCDAHSSSSGYWTLNNHNLYATDTSNNVGIGTQLPSCKLHVNGDFYAGPPFGTGTSMGMLRNASGDFLFGYSIGAHNEAYTFEIGRGGASGEFGERITREGIGIKRPDGVNTAVMAGRDSITGEMYNSLFWTNPGIRDIDLRIDSTGFNYSEGHNNVFIIHEDTATLSAQLKLVNGTQASGRILTSDAAGLANWQPLKGSNIIYKDTVINAVANSSYNCSVGLTGIIFTDTLQVDSFNITLPIRPINGFRFILKGYYSPNPLSQASVSGLLFTSDGSLISPSLSYGYKVAGITALSGITLIFNQASNTWY